MTLTGNVRLREHRRLRLSELSLHPIDFSLGYTQGTQP